MPYDLYVAPDGNGHYLNYFNILSEAKPDVKGVFLAAPTGRAGVKAVLDHVRQRGERPRAVHLLFGESYLPVALALRFRGYKVSSILYYVQHQRRTDLKGRVSRAALSLARLAGVRLLSLETPVAMPVGAFSGVLLDLNDLGASGETDNGSQADGTARILVAGHITERKMVLELMEALADLSGDIDRPLALRLVGKLAPSYREPILAAAKVLRATGVEVTIIDERVPDESLRQEMTAADLVFAIYRDHFGSSGMVVNALALGRPVLFFPLGALANMAALLPDNTQPESEADIAASIRAALAEPDRYRLDSDSRAAFIAARSPERFAEAFHAATERTG